MPLRSDGPRATRSTNWFRSPELAAHASARARYASDLPAANAVCDQPVPLSSGRAVRPAGVAAPSGSLTADALPPGGPLPPEELPAATAEPRVSVAAPVPENLAELLLGFPWTDHSRRRPECHYIIQYLISADLDPSAIATAIPVLPHVLLERQTSGARSAPPAYAPGSTSAR